MALRRIGDLDLSLIGQTVLVRAPGRGHAAKVPAAAVAVLAYCEVPRTRDEVAAVFGPPGAQLFEALAGAGYLEDPSVAGDTPVFFQNFASLDTHRRMLADRLRLTAYADALREVVRPGDVAIDAGTGSGVLAMLAARAGARRVFAIDNAEILEQARAVLAANGLTDVVDPVAGDFRSVALPEPAQVLVTETFGALAYAEGAAPDLRECLARNGPDATVVPARVELWCAPVGLALGEAVMEGFAPFEGLVFDPLRRASAHRGVTCEIPVDALLAEPVRLSDLPWPGFSDRLTAEARFTLPDGARASGLGAWFDLQMSPSVRLSTGPRAPLTHWKQVWLPVEVDGPELSVLLTIAPAASDRRGLEITGEVNGRPVHWRVR